MDPIEHLFSSLYVCTLASTTVLYRVSYSRFYCHHHHHHHHQHHRLIVISSSSKEIFILYTQISFMYQDFGHVFTVCRHNCNIFLRGSELCSWRIETKTPEFTARDFWADCIIPDHLTPNCSWDVPCVDVKDGCDDRNNAKNCVTAGTKKNDTNCDLRQLRLSGGWTTAPLVSPHIPDSDFPDRGQTQDLLQADLASSVAEMRFFFLHLAKNVFLTGGRKRPTWKGWSWHNLDTGCVGSSVVRKAGRGTH